MRIPPIMRRGVRRYRARPTLEPLETRSMPAGDLAVGGVLAGPGAVAWYTLDVTHAAVLTAAARPESGVGLRLVLAREDNVLATSEGTEADVLAGRLDVHLTPG